MNPVTIDQVLPLATWERVRPVLRPLFIHEKERRRLSVGDHLTLLFENAQSVWYQVQEMIRSERMTDPAAIAHELDTYNGLLPQPGELSATLFVEYVDPAERDAALRRLIGLERHLWLRLGERRIQATFEAGQYSGEQISAVQFVRFPLGPQAGHHVGNLAEVGAVAIEVDHPALSARATVEGIVARALVEDLREEG